MRELTSIIIVVRVRRGAHTRPGRHRLLVAGLGQQSLLKSLFFARVHGFLGRSPIESVCLVDLGVIVSVLLRSLVVLFQVKVHNRAADPAHPGRIGLHSSVLLARGLIHDRVLVSGAVVKLAVVRCFVFGRPFTILIGLDWGRLELFERARTMVFRDVRHRNRFLC